MDKEGKIILRENLGGMKGLRATAPSKGVWRHDPRNILNFRPSEITSGTFLDHLWFQMTRIRKSRRIDV